VGPFPQAARRGDAPDAGHAEIHEHDVRGVCVDEPRDLVAVAGLADDADALGPVEHHGQGAAHEGVVVDDEHPDRLAHVDHGRSAARRNSPSPVWPCSR
jgi:hypothetical protein